MVDLSYEPEADISAARLQPTPEAAERTSLLPQPLTARAPMIGAAVGLALFVALIVYNGVREVAAAVAVAGWGLLFVSFFHLAPLLANALGWRRLLAGTTHLPVSRVVWARWISDSVNGLLPVLQIGGNVVRARLIARHGVPGAMAAASVVVDITLNVLMQILFTLVGLSLLIISIGSPGGRPLVLAVVIGLAITGALLGGFYASQRRGLFRSVAGLLARVARNLDGGLTTRAAGLDAAVARLYGERRPLVATSSWHLLSWVLGVGEVWLGLYFLGHPVTLLSALLMESLTQAIRTAAFAVPGALGVQEGGFLLLGSISGIAPETALALSLVKRVRELLLGLPGLVAWQFEAAARVVGRNHASTRGAPE